MIPLWDVQISPLQTQSRIRLPGIRGVGPVGLEQGPVTVHDDGGGQSVTQFSRSVVSSSATPWITACQASLSITNSWSLPKIMSIELVMPSNHLTLCHPLFLQPSIFPSGSFQMIQLFTSGGQNIGVSASTPVLPMNTQDWFPLGWTGWISLQSKGLSRVFSNTTVQKHQFFCAQHETQDTASSNTFSHRFPVRTCQLSTPLVSFLWVWEPKASWNWSVLLRKWNLAHSPMPHSASQGYQLLLLKSHVSHVSYRSPQINNNANEKT